MNRILDISMPIHQDMPVYKDLDAKRTLFETTSDFTLGATHETRLHMDAHAGTHVDAPLHMIEGGGPEWRAYSCRNSFGPAGWLT